MNNQIEVCWECKKEEEFLQESGLCSLCEKWFKMVFLRCRNYMVRVKGRHYTIEDEDKDLFGMRGFDGAEFTIKFHDGRVVKTTNLWAQGVIPERFRGRLPDNAEFVGKVPSA